MGTVNPSVQREVPVTISLKKDPVILVGTMFTLWRAAGNQLPHRRPIGQISWIMRIPIHSSH